MRNIPFTPYHFGIVLPFLAWDWKKKRIDIVSGLLGTIIVDIRAIYLFIFTSDTNYHGIFHSFFFATILGIFVGIFMHISQGLGNNLLKVIKLEQKTSLQNKIIIASIFANSHIVLDAFLYEEMNIFYPFAAENPLFQVVPYYTIYMICIYGFILGFLIFSGFIIVDFLKNKYKKNEIEEFKL